MQASTLHRRALAHYEKMNVSLDVLSKMLSDLIGDDRAGMFFQMGDGCVALWGDSFNTPITDMDAFFSLDKAHALKYLRANTI